MWKDFKDWFVAAFVGDPCPYHPEEHWDPIFGDEEAGIHCVKCWQEAARKDEELWALREREEQIEIIKEGILRAEEEIRARGGA